ncbi:hypothetical protein ACIRON_25740 [Nocardioides sp. NPDC101246]|uniref:hypothetical protein n=1 Tax=Nocardioides sp. NPDC101246 TaxID=3364336 RepID=UPI003820605A
MMITVDPLPATVSAVLGTEKQWRGDEAALTASADMVETYSEHERAFGRIPQRRLTAPRP